MTGRISRAICALIVIVAVVIVGAAALAESIDVKLNTSAKVYSSLSSDAQSIRAPKGLQVRLKACENGWGKITYKGNTGYVRLKYLDRVEPLKAYVTKSATVYKDAGASKKLTTVSTGTLVYVVGVDGSYVRIQSKSGKWKGYIEAGLLSSSKPAAATPVSNGSVPKELRATQEGAKASKIEMTIYVAQSLIGVPYSDKPNPPKSFDCARYTAYCYGKAWEDVLKSSTKEQGYDSRFDKIEKIGDLKRGDLVCFNTVDDNDLSDHVGIYLGKGYFLHSSSVAKKVIVSQLNSGYYNRVFSWGRRIFS